MKLISISVPAIVLLSFASTRSKVIYPTYVEYTKASPAIAGAAKPSALSGALAADLEAAEMYDQILPEAGGLSQNAFLMALRGYRHLKTVGQLKNTQVITIIDYTLSSLKKRLFVIDVSKGKVLYNTYVSHGMNSGKEYAHKFSNSLQSFESSLGFYVTLGTYFGKNGLALRLKGMEKGINDNAVRRGIVLHGAGYVSERYGQQQGFMGRSEGCPALPKKESSSVIHSIRNGSMIFAYFPSQKYLEKTKLLVANVMDPTEGFYAPLP